MGKGKFFILVLASFLFTAIITAQVNRDPVNEYLNTAQRIKDISNAMSKWQSRGYMRINREDVTEDECYRLAQQRGYSETVYIGYGICMSRP